MAIDPLQETLISLKDAAKLFPKNARGKHPHISCIYRYTTTGCRGVVLESVQAGSVRCTSREAVARFFKRLTERVATNDTSATTPPSDQSAKEAGKILDETLFRSRQQDHFKQLSRTSRSTPTTGTKGQNDG